MPDPNIARIRRFNRQYITQLGLFARDYVGKGLSVSDLRIYFEIIENPDRSARQLSHDLDIDEAQTSRALKRYIDMGWLERSRSRDDARRKQIQVTAEGRRGYELLSKRAEEKTRERLVEVNLSQLAEKMDDIMRLLGHMPEQAIDIRDLSFGDAGWIAQRHAETYAVDPGFAPEFETFVFAILADFIANRGLARQRGFIAWRGESRIGSIFCTASEDPDVAKLRLFYIEPDARGAGLGKRLLNECLSFARGSAYKRMTLVTHESQTLARSMYAKAGFFLTSSRPDHIFGRDTVEELWELEL
ncbi:MAG: MarR family transcriptional regulator [Boseongicola sp.]|nr:helix-turn-helix domain-containing GNAT family N-acetyltransferase [Boseongicola sp.]NNL18151.1 MarR family transcriptional regulator [Boseongicola sp.]